jgi:hypothetical protein
MRFRVSRLILTVVGTTFLAASAASQTDKQRDQVEQILTRAVLERGAFLACARLDTNRQTAELLVKGWQLDLADAGTILRAIGFTDDDVRALRERYDIEKAAPKFADLASLGAYCDVLGDWRSRWARLTIILPQVELRRLVKP